MSGSARAEPLDVVFDMETKDPDDFLTLLLLLGHPRVNLKAVTIEPGTFEQVNLVGRTLEWFAREDVPVGAFKFSLERDRVSPWHYEVFGRDVVKEPIKAHDGAELLEGVCDNGTTLLCGAPPKNIGAALKRPRFKVGRVVMQGGFAGEGVVPMEKQLEKFRGRTTCPSYNPNHDPKTVLELQSSKLIRDPVCFVSKNVCHGIVFTEALDAAFRLRLAELPMFSANQAIARHRLSLEHVYKGLLTLPGKALHDLFAACCALDESVAEWANVEIFREKGEWGSRLSADSRTAITVAPNYSRFIDVLLA